MRIPALALVSLLVAAVSARAGEDADVRVTKWLVLAPVDGVARRTLRPDAVFATYLLDRTSAPPKEGDEVTGTLGKPAKWATKDADKDGDVELASGGWAYASVESPAERVVVAKLEGAATLYVNGAGFTGDVYRLGDIGVPVALRKGTNDVYVAAPRGGFRLSFRKPETQSGSDLYIGRRTVADRFETAGPLLPGLLQLFNATTATAPLAGRKLAPLGVGYCSSDGTEIPDPRRVAKPGEAYRRTFVSSIDGSVQSYALVPPSPEASADRPVGLVLSLHGAGVECMEQAKAYAPKPDFWIVCPTNRGRYGFDWQDWGRLDAYEVLGDALKVTGVDPRRVYLTGHSMGGHGTWHLAANDPGRFLAIAPSAGWSSFESYGAPRVTTPLGWMWRAADGASQTLDLVENLAQVPTYVLHGEKDDNVPLAEAQLMVDAVTRAGGKPEFHVEPGVGHWWDKDKERPGADCVDWPGIWELFRKTQPPDIGPYDQSLQVMDPSILSAGFDEIDVRVEQPLEYGRASRVVVHFADGKLDIKTENVRQLRVIRPRVAFALVDGRVVTARTNVPQPPLPRIDEVTRSDGAWPVFGGPYIASGEKRSDRSGPFKRAFTNRFLLVYGTAGTDTEDAELLEKARYDSEVWAYRANGDANLMSDAQFLAGDFADRNVIVYGNADTNSAWTSVFDDDCPIQARRGTMTVGGTTHDGALAAAFVRPRRGSTSALAAAFADTGATATRLFYQFPVFSSGVGIPDYVVFGPGFLTEWDGDVRAAGWFDWAWRMR